MRSLPSPICHGTSLFILTEPNNALGRRQTDVVGPSRNLDVLAYFTVGFFPFGTASYLIWPTTHPVIIATTLHHVWMIPLAFAVLRGNARLPLTLILYAMSYVFVLAILCRVITPLSFDGVYLNVNMAHEWWKDSPGDFFHQFDDAPAPIYLLYGCTIANTFNAVAFFAFKAIYDLLVNRGFTDKLKKKLN